MSERWWITTDVLTRGGEKVLGPFESSELALQVRTYYEAHAHARGRTFCVDREPVSEGPSQGGET